MCTAATYKTKDFYMGRTLDYERSYGDNILVTPRNYPIRFKCREPLTHHYAMIGMGAMMQNTPLYYEAFNEKGLGICGLNFVGNCAFFPEAEGKDNIAQYELIPWLLGTCEHVSQAREKLQNLNLVGIPFLPSLPVAQLHWIVADASDCITLEITADGVHIYDNPVGVLTNNPPFPYQMFNLNNYRHLSIDNPENTFGTDLNAAGMNTIVGYVYDMLYGNAGGYPSYASAAAIVLFSIVLTITVINLLVSKKHVHYV